MDFYLTEIKANNQEGIRIQFPMNPEQVALTTGVITQDYTIMQLGEVRIPFGNKLDVVSWEGKLPGAARADMSFVKAWTEPAELFAILKKFKETGVTLRLLITETPINLDVFIEQFDPKWQGGFGDIDYTLTLTEDKEMKIYTVEESQAKNTVSTTTVATSRTSKPKPKTYTVKPGDSLWKIAQKELGNGARYPEIAKLSKPPLGSDPNKIYPGQVLTLPA